MRKNILIICLYFLSTFVFADDDKVVTITVSEFPPFEFVQDGKASGFSVDLITEVFEAAGYEPKFIDLPWTRALEAAQVGEIDVITNIRDSVAREKYFIYSDPILYSEHYFFKKKTLDIHPTNFTEIQSYSIATVNGYFYGQNFVDAKFKNLVPMSSSAPGLANLRKLVAGRVDLVACQISVCSYLINKYKEEFTDIDYITSLPIDVDQPSYIAFPKAHPERSQRLLLAFNTGLKQYIAEGKKKELINKYNIYGIK